MSEVSRFSSVMNWNFEPKTQTLKSWQSAVYANPGSGHRQNETKGSKGCGVNKASGKRDCSSEFVGSVYTSVVPKSMVQDGKNPVFFFDAISPTGRQVVIRAEFFHRAKNSNFKIHSIPEMMGYFAASSSVF